MSSGPRRGWKTLERWSPWLFLTAGLLLAVYALLNGLEASTDMTFEQKGLEVAYVLGFLGLLGLYPKTVDRRPWLVRVGAIAAGLGVIAFSVFTLNNVAEFAGLVSGDPPGWSIFAMMAAVGFILGYFAFAAAVLRSNSLPKIIGLVLLVPPIVIVFMIAHLAVGMDSPGSVFVVSAGHVVLGSLETHFPVNTIRTAGEERGRRMKQTAHLGLSRLRNQSSGRAVEAHRGLHRSVSPTHS